MQDNTSQPAIIITEFPLTVGTEWLYEYSSIELEYTDSSKQSVRKINKFITIKIEKDTSLQSNIIVKKLIYDYGNEINEIRYLSAESNGIYEYIWNPFGHIEFENTRLVNNQTTSRNDHLWLKILWLKLPLITQTKWAFENDTYTNTYGFKEKEVLSPDYFLVKNEEVHTLEVFSSNLNSDQITFLPFRRQSSEWISEKGIVKILNHEEKIAVIDTSGNYTGSYYDKDERYILKSYSIPKN